jgi:hypothetical protein
MMTGRQLSDILNQMELMNRTLLDVLALLRDIRRGVDQLPQCNCAGHVAGDTWVCLLHGDMIRIGTP